VGTPGLAVSIDWHAAGAGALADLGVLAPVVSVYTALHATGVITGDAGVIVTAVIAVFVAPLVGGAVAARSASSGPLTNASVAATLGVGVYLVFRVIDAVVRSRPLSPGSAVTLAMLSVLAGAIGGAVGARLPRR
jgi:hypothetical protein